MKHTNVNDNNANQNVDLQILTEILNDWIIGHSHEFIRDIYKLNKSLGRKLQRKFIPISYMYHLSLDKKFANEYKDKTDDEIAILEETDKSTICNFKKCNYHSKFKIR